MQRTASRGTALWAVLLVTACDGPDRRAEGSTRAVSGGSAGTASEIQASGGSGGGRAPSAEGGSAGATGVSTATGGTGGTVTASGGASSGGGAVATGRGGGGQTDGGRADAGSGGSGGVALASYLLGADVTFVQADEAAGVTYSDGAVKDIFSLLKDHGFNAIRLRTFVDPRAADGYDRQQGYGDLAHTIAFGRRIKNAGMTFLLDFHYSDNWADPGKQCIPVSWQGLSLPDMARTLHDYTKDAVTQLIAAGARPDLIQIGNEITPGMLIHVCDANGQPLKQGSVNGSVANWANLGTLLKAGIGAVREVDAGIKVVLHIDRCGDKPSERAGTALAASIDWVTKAMNQGVVFDVLGESCYQAFQGDPSSAERTKKGWSDTLSGLSARFPGIELLAAEYGALEREINDVVYALPARRGVGTFYWEPTHETQGNTGHTLFVTSGNPRLATPDLSLYDEMRAAYAPRL